jgi:hypothetical protein
MLLAVILLLLNTLGGVMSARCARRPVRPGVCGHLLIKASECLTRAVWRTRSCIIQSLPCTGRPHNLHMEAFLSHASLTVDDTPSYCLRANCPHPSLCACAVDLQCMPGDASVLDVLTACNLADPHRRPFADPAHLATPAALKRPARRSWRW